jgi:hypothetical protein
MALPLVGGEIHDWNWMLGQLGLVEHCTSLSRLVHLAGLGVAAAAWIAAFRAAKASATPDAAFPRGYEPRDPFAPPPRS